ncbi:hypothetical protein E2C01_099748 [Portunus trituberculatus]|uniref:Uncharacterized protein n=1 Tax=Portunus trituberculatus TaxID=210409 RepID=A0A5B7KFN7_PORTR|nr:hypothetical protein [Portunus trituberculatus]
MMRRPGTRSVRSADRSFLLHDAIRKQASKRKGKRDAWREERRDGQREVDMKATWGFEHSSSSGI